jgi:hypothetical protein
LGALAAAAERDRAAAGLGELAEQLDGLAGGDGVLEREQVVEVRLVRRVEVAEVTAHIAGAHDADPHVDRAEGLPGDEFLDQVRVRQHLVRRVRLV